MRLKFLLLYSLLFSYSSLFASVWNSSSCSSGLASVNISNYWGIVENANSCESAGKGHTIHWSGNMFVCSGGGIYGISGNNLAGYSGSYRCFTPDCVAPEYYDVSTQSCVAPDTCTPPQIWNSETKECEDPPAPECLENELLNEETNECDCVEGFVKFNSSCVADNNSDGKPDMPTAETDTDGDGIPDISDGDSPFNGLCLGLDRASTPTYYGVKYPISNYSYNSMNSSDACELRVNISLFNVDGSYSLKDKNPNCSTEYCFVHKLDEYYSSSNPCDVLYDQVSASCGDNFRVDGYSKCTHNGMQVTNDTIKCVPLSLSPELDCSSLWHEELSADKKSCECKEGYVRNTFGDCWIPLFPEDSNTTAEQEAQNRQHAENLHNDKIDNNNSLNSQFSDQIQNDVLSGIREDLSKSNELLDDISKKLNDSNNSSSSSLIDASGLDDVDSLLDNADTYYENWKSQFTTFSENVNEQFSNIDTQYNNARALFDSEKTFTVPSGSTSNCLSFTFRGKVINFDLCTSFALLSPIVYFITTLLFMIGTFRFMVNHLLRGLE